MMQNHIDTSLVLNYIFTFSYLLLCHLRTLEAKEISMLIFDALIIGNRICEIGGNGNQGCKPEYKMRLNA